jgi:hypothetical protein
MSEDDDFAQLKELESIAKTRNEEKALKVLDVLLADLSLDADGPLDDACKAIDEWGVRMDAVITKNIDYESIGSFVAIVSKHKREIEMAQLARERHAKSQPAIQWVRNEWATKSSEYRSKREFGQTYVQLVLEDFPEIKKITWRTIAEDWLKDLLPK